MPECSRIEKSRLSFQTVFVTPIKNKMLISNKWRPRLLAPPFTLTNDHCSMLWKRERARTPRFGNKSLPQFLVKETH